MDRETLERAADVLRQAHDILLRDGIVCGEDNPDLLAEPGTLKPKASGPTCLEFAITEAAMGHRGYLRLDDPLRDVIRGTLPTERSFIWSWNDAPGRTPDEVLQACLDGEKALREQAGEL